MEPRRGDISNIIQTQQIQKEAVVVTHVEDPLVRCGSMGGSFWWLSEQGPKKGNETKKHLGCPQVPCLKVTFWVKWQPPRTQLKTKPKEPDDSLTAI